MISLGLLASLSTIIFKSGKSLTTKIAASETDSYITSFATRIVGVIIAGLLLVILSENIIIPTKNIFWFSLIANSILLSLSTIFLTIGFKESDISIVAPLMAFIPLATILPAIFILNQVPTILSFFGIVLVTSGAYVINIQEKEKGIFEPIKSLYYDKGARYAFYGVISSGFIPTFSKLGITYTSELMWLFLIAVCTSLILLAILYVKKNEIDFRDSKSSIHILILVGLFNTLLGLAQLYAYNYIDVAYVQAIKRINILFTILIGSLYFNEPRLKQRLLSGIIMVAGVILIILGM